MRHTPTVRLTALVVALSLTGCAGPIPTSLSNGIPQTAERKGIAGNGNANAPGYGQGNGNGNVSNGNGNDAVHGDGGAGNPTAPTTPGASPAEPSTGSNGGSGTGTAVPGVGLSTFFDTYNFNFPVPDGQALGTVAKVSHKYVAPEGGKVYLQIGLQTVEQAAGMAKQPLNVSFVFDKSGSMYGDKIEYSRIAAKKMVDQLGESDTFSLVTFDTAVDTLIAPNVGGDKEAIKFRIDGIKPGSQTNIDGGLKDGYSHVQTNYKGDRINRVILMSDGAANVGIVDPQVLGERAAAFAREGITLTTIGVGTGFNESFMTHLAKQGGGSFYFVNSAEEAQQAFVGEIQALQRTVAKNVDLNITMGEGVELVQIYGHTTKTVGQSLNVDSSDLIAGQSKVILLELKVPARAAGTQQSVAKVSVNFDDIPFGGRKTATAEAKVDYTSDAAQLATPVDTQLASSVIILQTAAHLIKAAELLDAGKTSEAKTELAQQLEVVQAKATELNDQDLKDEVANLKQYLDRIGVEDAEVLKKELQFDAFQKQQGRKKVVQPAA